MVASNGKIKTLGPKFYSGQSTTLVPDWRDKCI